MAKGVVFSEYEIRSIGFKFGEGPSYDSVECIGSCDEALDTRKIIKKCRGIIVKEVVKGTGTGKLKITAHIPYDIFCKMYGMDNPNLVTGVKSYGSTSKHESFSMVADVFDEDDKEKFKAYPNCIMESGVTQKIKNGEEEVAELELEISIMPDEKGQGLYEVLVDDLAEDTKQLKTNWMTKFTPELVAVEAA